MKHFDNTFPNIKPNYRKYSSDSLDEFQIFEPTNQINTLTSPVEQLNMLTSPTNNATQSIQTSPNKNETNKLNNSLQRVNTIQVPNLQLSIDEPNEHHIIDINNINRNSNSSNESIVNELERKVFKNNKDEDKGMLDYQIERLRMDN